MRRIDLTPYVIQGQQDDSGKPAAVQVRLVLSSWCFYAAMKGGQQMAPPYFPAFDKPVEQRLCAKVLHKLDAARAFVDLSDEQHALLQSLMNLTPYRTTRQCVAMDRVDDALDPEDQKNKGACEALEAADKEMREKEAAEAAQELVRRAEEEAAKASQPAEAPEEAAEGDKANQETK